jgi:ankyrin repeat protein
MRVHLQNRLKRLVLACFCFVTATAWADPAADYLAAARRDDEASVVRLVLRGVDLNTVDEQGNHALLLAIRDGAAKVPLFLLDQPLVQVEARNQRGESALMIAALKGQLRLVQRLIERKAEVNKPGWTPLHYAATHNEGPALDVVRLLLEHHAYIDAASPNGTTPLMMAAQYGRPDVVRLLLEEGADASLRNEQGLTALDFAQRAQRKDAEQMLQQALRARQPRGTW